MATTYEQVMTILSTDPWTGDPFVLHGLQPLTVGDYQKWLRKQVRLYGRRAEVGTTLRSPVDLFVKEVTGLDYRLQASGDAEVYVGNVRYVLDGPQVLAYYLYNEDGLLITKAGAALDCAMLENPMIPLGE